MPISLLSKLKKFIAESNAIEWENGRFDDAQKLALFIQKPLTEESVLEYHKSLVPNEDWADKDKTFILLNWWSTADLQSHRRYLEEMKVKYKTFQEPDLWDIITAVAFLAQDWDAVTRYFTPLFKLA